jgi:hypothetical protein
VDIPIACCNRTDKIDVESSCQCGRKMLFPDCGTQVFGVGTDVAYTPYVSRSFRVVNMCSAPSKEFADKPEICTGID